MANNDRTVAAELGDRTLFPRLRARAYLNHAAISALSEPAAEAMARWADDFQARGSGAFVDWLHQRDGLRKALAALISAPDSTLAWMPNTMHGVNAIAQSFPWQRGDRVLLTRGEYPTNVVPWLRAAELFGLEVLWMNAQDLAEATPRWDALDHALQQRPRVLALSAVQFQSGLRMPMAAISERCRAAGTRLFVDGVQACGATPIDVDHDGVDYLACGSHKWLMGAEGAGFLYVRDECMAELKARVTGAMSYEGAFDLLGAGPGHLRYDRPLRRDARVFEGGMLAGASCAALGASVQLIASIGVPSIFDHVQRYHDAIEPLLVERGFISLRAPTPALRSGILSFAPPAQVFSPTLCALLAEEGVVCSSPDGVLRIAPHWPNALSEVPHVIAAIDACLARLPH